MNFLAHFYLDREHPDSIFAIGAATPDLLSIFNGKLRLKKHHITKLDPQSLTTEDYSLLDGIQRHFLADKVFHSSELFVQETRFISQLLIDYFPETEISRKYFIAHILLELLLDKVLIEENPNLLEEYYTHFGNAQPFLQVRKTTEKVTREELPNYEGFLHKFWENRYLVHYTDFDHIIYVMNRILGRVKIMENEFLSMPAFTLLMKAYQERLKLNYQLFFDEILAWKEEQKSDPGKDKEKQPGEDASTGIAQN